METPVQCRFDAQSTAEEVAAGVDLSGKLAIVTGAAAGIGKETARVLARAGADVVIAGRTPSLLEQTAAEIALAATGKLMPFDLDLMSLRSVSDFATRVVALERPVDLLILNAGIMACPLARSARGIESQFATNFVGHALLTSRLAAALIAANQPRVISLSSNAHQMSPIVFEDVNFATRPYDAWEAYAQSKTANVLLAVHVWQQLGDLGVTAHALHPGGIRTGLLKHVSPNLGAELGKKYKYDTTKIQVKTVPQGAATTVWAATEPSLLQRPALFLADCAVADVLQTQTYSGGVMGYALDCDNAARLWGMTEAMIGIPMRLKPS